MTQRAIRMSHPDLEQDITVAESAVPTHLASGWTPVDDTTDLAPDTAGGPVVIEQPDVPAVDPAPLPDLNTPKGE